MLNAASLDSEASQPVEARPSSDPLPATVPLIQGPGQPVHQSSITSIPVTAAPMAHGDKGAIEAGSATPMPIPTDTTAADSTHAPPTQQLDSKLGYAQSPQAQLKQVAEHKALHDEAQRSLELLQQLERSPANIVLDTEWGQANGHGGEPSPPALTQQTGVLDLNTSITDEDDAALLADMQGFASALGCDWQVHRPGMVSLGTLPLPGAHITTLTSLANFKPGHADKSQTNQCDSELDASSLSAGVDSQESELDTDDELEAAYEDRQAANMRQANTAYDIAMSRVAAEDNQASFRPHWPDDPTHASHASFDDWAANGLHANGTPKALSSHGSFSFANGCQETPAHPELQYRQPVPSAWPDSVPEASVQESGRGSIDVQAVQHLFQDFLQKAGLDSHLEVRATLGLASGPHCQRNVTVQNVLPCGSFMKIQLN
ncbi:TPA: hypothetical protein ACH3X1_005183 [Trebouxia sp. C0004]